MDGELTSLKQGPGAITSYEGIDVSESQTQLSDWTELLKGGLVSYQGNQQRAVRPLTALW